MGHKESNQTNNRAWLNSLSASGDFCHVLVTFADNLDPDQARHIVGSHLDPNCFTLGWFSLFFFLKDD